MSYTAPFVDSTGLHIPAYTDIRDSLLEEMKVIYGSDIYLVEDTQDYQMVSALSLMISDAMQSILLAYNNANPVTAIGTGLDRLVALNGINRRTATQSICTVTITGTEGTIITDGVVSDLNGINWELPSTVTIPVALTIDVIATCTEFGPVQVPAGGINLIITPVQGWTSVLNANVATPGTYEETDSELRERQAISAASSSRSNFESVLASILDIDGVTKCTGYENDTGITVGVYPAHSVCFCVEGGIDYNIAYEIYLRKTIGAETYGDVPISIVGEFGNTSIINFQRPVEVDAIVDITITALPSYNSAILDTIKANVVAAINAMTIGEDLYISNLYSAVLSAFEGYATPPFYVTALTVNTEAIVLVLDDFETLVATTANITITVV